MPHSADSNAEQHHFDPDAYLDMTVAKVPGYLDLQDEVARATVGVSGNEILELGVGTGETSARVLAVHPAARLVGIDESAAMIERARQRLPNADLRVQRLEEPLPWGSFDLIVSALAVHHLDGAGKADLFQRIAGRLRHGGRFVLGDVVLPDRPDVAVTPVDGTYDKPSRVVDQLRWLEEAGLRADVSWTRDDLVVVVADHH